MNSEVYRLLELIARDIQALEGLEIDYCLARKLTEILLCINSLRAGDEASASWNCH